MVELGYVMREEQQLYTILLDQNMYRNVDAALRFFEKYSGILMTNLGLTQIQTDPCIFFKHNEAGKLNLLISTHVDDSLIGGRKWGVEEFFKQLVKYLKIERLGKLKKHLGVWWEWMEDSDTGKVYLKATMPKMVQEIKEAYANVMGHLAKQEKTPGFPGKCLRKAKEEDKEVRTTEYHLIVGKLMYYMTKVGPELGNAVRELAGQIVKPNSKHWWAVECVVGYVTHKPFQGVIFRKPRNLRPYIYADSNYAMDENDQRSISGRMSTLVKCWLDGVPRSRIRYR